MEMRRNRERSEGREWRRRKGRRKRAEETEGGILLGVDAPAITGSESL